MTSSEPVLAKLTRSRRFLIQLYLLNDALSSCLKLDLCDSRQVMDEAHAKNSKNGLSVDGINGYAKGRILLVSPNATLRKSAQNLR